MSARFSAIVVIMLFLASGQVYADSAGKLVSKGNREYDGDNYEKAAVYYEKASVKLPESPIIAFNLGNVLYRKDDFSGAREYFEDAALKTRDISFEAGAWYNMGNCAFGEAGRQADSDMEKALEFYKESVSFYATALEKDPGLTDAAHNMEITRLYIKDLLDRIKKQQEQMKEMQEKMKEVVDSLSAATGRQQGALDKSLELDGGEGQGQMDRLAGDQEEIGESTGSVRDRLRELFPGEQPEPVRQASSHLDSAIVNQDDAVDGLSAKEPDSAAVDQEKALSQMKKALEILTQGDNQDQNGQEEKQDRQGEQEQKEQQPPEQQQKQEQAGSETARGILEEEKENRKKRKQQVAGGYKKVDKDW